MTAIAVSQDRSTFLRRALLVDAATCLVTGALLAIDAAPLSSLLALPIELLRYSGISLFPIAAFMAWVATRTTPPRPGVWLVIAGNAGWVLGSVLVMAVCSPTILGYAFVAAQAVAVALLAELEYVGLRRAAA
jgi:hypothetical protein